MTDRVTRSSAGAVQKRAATEDTASAPSGGPLDIQMMMAAGGNQAMVQLSGEGGGTDQVHAAAAQGIASGGGALPHVGAIQQAFGKHDVSGVQAHTGSAAAAANDAMGANAYATGNHVAFKGAPDLHTAAHEAAHVVQQRGGVALDGGVGKVGDSYEQHADAVADKVVKGESAEGLLDAMGGGGAGGSVQQKAVQREGDGKEDDKGGADKKDEKKGGEEATPTPVTMPDVFAVLGQANKTRLEPLVKDAAAIVQKLVALYGAGYRKQGDAGRVVYNKTGTFADTKLEVTSLLGMALGDNKIKGGSKKANDGTSPQELYNGSVASCNCNVRNFGSQPNALGTIEIHVDTGGGKLIFEFKNIQ